jgi:hypothetical protein
MAIVQARTMAPRSTYGSLMPFVGPTYVRLPRRSLARADVVFRAVAARVRGRDRASVVAQFAFKDDELLFARALLDRQSRFWLYRVNQRAFGGDFVVIDVSSPVVARRRAFAVELKRGERARVRDSGGVQQKNAPRVIEDIAATGVIDRDARPAFLVGDTRAILSFFDGADELWRGDGRTAMMDKS